jgi:DNA polymerase III subunit delta'
VAESPLDSIIGQAPAVAALRRASHGEALPQSLLFVGPEGVGKTATALALLKERLGADPLTCRRIDDDQHPDIARIAPDGELTRIWQLWSRPGHPAGALETLRFAPIAGPRRAYLLERAETLNEESANSLLKALEEPPPYVQFILCAPSPASVLETVLSRCQVIRFSAVPAEEIARLLVEKKGLPPDEARVLAAYAEGAPGKALRLADAPELRAQRDALLDLAVRLSEVPPIGGLRLAEELRKASAAPKPKKGEEEVDTGPDKSARGDLGRALDVLAAWHGDLIAASLHGENARLVHADRAAQIRAAAARYRPEQLAENLQTLFQFRRHVARNANQQLLTEVLLMKLAPR